MNLKKHIDTVLRAVLAVEALFLLQLPTAAVQPLGWLATAGVFGAFVPSLAVAGILLADSGLETRAIHWLRRVPRSRRVAAGCIFAAAFFAGVSGQILLTEGWGGALGGLLIAIAFVSIGIHFVQAEPVGGDRHEANPAGAT